MTVQEPLQSLAVYQPFLWMTTEAQFEEVQEEVARLQGEGFEVVVMGDFNAHIGLGDEQHPNRNGQRLLNLVWADGLVIGNELPQCQGRWTWECGQKRSVIDYILLSGGWSVQRMLIEDLGEEGGWVRP